MILEILKELKQFRSKEFSLININSYQFQDGFIIKSNSKQKLILLKINDNPMGLLGFTIHNRKITIDAIQGIKNKNLKHPVNWYEKLLSPFIYACIKTYQTPENLSKYIYYKDIKKNLLARLELIEKTIERIKIEIKKEKNPSLKNILKYQLNERYKELELKKSRFILTKKIRDDFFTKEGFINLNKKRIINIINSFNKNQENKQITIKKFENIRRRINRRH